MYPETMHPVAFLGGAAGTWTVERLAAVTGDALPPVERIHVEAFIRPAPAGDDGGRPACAWVLRGVAGHVRYVEGTEKRALDAVSPPLGRPEATRAALIPIRKSSAWWALPQDERRAIFEGRTRHIADCMPYLPRIARRLYHARDLGEPFDFLTWFEFAPEHAHAFEDLVGMLRAREEWSFVEREVDLRLARD
jgi:hypothetical protein